MEACFEDQVHKLFPIRCHDAAARLSNEEITSSVYMAKHEKHSIDGMNVTEHKFTKIVQQLHTYIDNG